jgi:hypothetical protein
MLSLSRALLYIFLSTVSISGTATLGWLYYIHLDHARSQDDKNLITAIVQTGPVARQLPSSYLTELMGLSSDQPINLYTFNCQQAVRRLMASPHITSVNVARLRPNAIYVDYNARQPCAYLKDFENTLIDRDGVPFPASPYYTPKRLPELITGIDTIEWGKAERGKHVRLALALLCLLEQKGIRTECIDVSRAYHESSGRAEVILKLETGPVSLLRMCPEDLTEQLSDYHLLCKNLSEDDRVVADLRIPNLAFIANAQ